MQLERRPAPRFALRAPVEFRGGDITGHGTIENISASGALVEGVSPPVPQGTALGLQPSYYPGSSEVELWAEVVRTTDTGFAVRFINLGSSALELLRSVLPPGLPKKR